MQAQFYSREQWFDLNQQLQDHLNLSSQNHYSYVYPDAQTAVLETLWGLSRQFMTKKKIYCLKGGTPYLSLPLQLLISRGFEVYEWDSDKFFEAEEWTESLDMSVLAVIYPIDVPFTGQVFSLEKIRKKLVEKKCLSIEISHNHHLCRGIHIENNPTHVQIFDFVGGGSFAIAGRRAVHEPLVAKGMNWHPFDLQTLLAKVGSDKEDLKTVKSVETQIGILDWKFPQGDRLFDRIVFSLKDCAADAIIEYLQSLDGGLFRDLTTPSLLQWGGLSTMDWLVPVVGDLSLIRGMVVAPLESVEGSPKKLLEGLASFKRDYLQA